MRTQRRKEEPRTEERLYDTTLSSFPRLSTAELVKRESIFLLNETARSRPGADSAVPKARDDNRDFRPICPRFPGAEPAKM